MRTGLWTAVLLSILTIPVWGAPELHVYSVAFAGQTYVTGIPAVRWSGATVRANPSGWVTADDYLVLQTNERYAQGSWAIQIFTDNTYVAEARGTYALPDAFQGTTFVPGGTQSGPVTPHYNGQQAFQPKPTDPIQFPKSGLISDDGRERLPVIWRVLDPPSGRPQPPSADDLTENLDKTHCDFKNCDWLFFQDKGDQKMVPGFPITSNWTDNFWYTQPLNTQGAQWSVFSRFQPTAFNGWTSQLLYLATNFRNATRQPYATTLFVELTEY